MDVEIWNVIKFERITIPNKNLVSHDTNFFIGIILLNLCNKVRFDERFKKKKKRKEIIDITGRRIRGSLQRHVRSRI